MPPEEAPPVAVVGPTAALHGRAGGPGFAVPPGAVSGLYDPAHRSGWQLAQAVWAESGIGWEPAAVGVLSEPGWIESPHGRSPGPAGQDTDWHAGDSPAADRQDGPYQDGPDPDGDWEEGDLPLGAPTYAGAPAYAPAPAPAGGRGPAHPAAPLPDRWRAGEPSRGSDDPDELYRAWQGSVRQAAAQPKMTATRRRQVWHVIRVGVPVAVLVTVGAGALMMLTGKTSGMLASRGDEGSPAGGAGDSAVAFAGYPGQRGTVTVNSIAAAGGTSLAVGSADGHPAIWRRAGDGTWTLVSASSPAVDQRPGVESLTSVAHGPLGWIAVGGVVSGAAQQPVVVTSSNGVTWQAVTGATFAGPGTFVMGVTASRSGYVVVGKQVSGGRTFAALWWSADLRNWVTGSNGGLDGRLESSAVYAVGATATGFVAAGTHGGGHTIWTSADGRNWSVYDVPKPPGATDALLSQVAVNGTLVVTAGDVIGKAGDVPVVVVSTDGGRHWRQILLDGPAGLGSVTALTAAGSGFVAAGQAGPAGAQHAVTWSSPDGLTWSAATPVSAGQITALTAADGTVSGTAQRGAAPSVVTLAAP